MAEHRDGDRLDVLLVEDNPGDVRLIEEALGQGPVDSELHVAPDGEVALDFLRRRGRHVDAPRPDIVLLDLNLPKRDGREVLTAIKDDPDLLRIPVVVLTSSDARTDVVESYERRASAYVTKPVDADAYMDLVRSFEEFWGRFVRLPPGPDGDRNADG